MYIIVEHANDEAYEHYFSVDPKTTEMHIKYSHIYPHPTKEQYKLFYQEHEKLKAHLDCSVLNVENPGGHYLVCRLDLKSLDHVK